MLRMCGTYLPRFSSRLSFSIFLSSFGRFLLLADFAALFLRADTVRGSSGARRWLGCNARWPGCMQTSDLGRVLLGTDFGNLKLLPLPAGLSDG